MPRAENHLNHSFTDEDGDVRDDLTRESVPNPYRKEADRV